MQNTKKPKNRLIAYLKDSWHIFIQSFKDFNLQLLFVIVMDLVFFALGFLVLYVAGQILTKQAIGLPNISTIGSLSVDKAQVAAAGFTHFLYTLAIVLVIFIFFMLINWSFTRLSIWNLVIHGKFQVKKFWRFVVANLAWFLMWLVPIIYAIYPLYIMVKQQMQVTQPPLFTVISLTAILVALPHFTYLFFIGFIREQKIGKAIAFAFRTGTVKIRFFVLPYIVMLLVFMLTSIIIYYPLLLVSPKINFVITLIVILAYLAWLRSYLSKIVLAINH